MKYVRKCKKCGVYPKLRHVSDEKFEKTSWFYICPVCQLRGEEVVSDHFMKKYITQVEANDLVKNWNDALGVDFIYVKNELLTVSRRKAELIETIILRPLSKELRDSYIEELKELAVQEKGILADYLELWEAKKKEMAIWDNKPSICVEPKELKK